MDNLFWREARRQYVRAKDMQAWWWNLKDDWKLSVSKEELQQLQETDETLSEARKAS